MKHFRLHTLAVCGCLAFLAIACSKKKPNYPPHQIAPLYEVIWDFASADSSARAEILQRDSLELKAYMAAMDCDVLTDSLLLAISESRPVREFTPEVRKVFPSLQPVEQPLGYYLGSAAAMGLTIPDYLYTAVVWGRHISIGFYDNRVMMIALNHYLGSDHPAYSSFPAYRRQVKQPAVLPYDMAESITAQAYPYDGGDNATLLSRMLYDGALTYVKMHTVEEPQESLAMGYTDAQLNWLAENEKNIWKVMASDKLIFDTSRFKIERIMDPAPATDLIHPSSPGRTGRYIGYRIVCAYMKKHADTPATKLLSPAFYNSESTLIEASYNP